MSQTIVRSREDYIEKLRELNFYGPTFINGHQFMLYHGQAMIVPENKDFSCAQFRFLLKEVDDMISQEEWKF